MTWTKQRLNNLFFLLGVAAVVVMLFTFDVSFVELWDHLCHAGYWLIPIVGIWIVVYGINALSWMAVIRGNADPNEVPSFWRIYRLTITGYALNYATPVGGLGGEPYRIMELSRDMTKQHATSSVILYAMMHVFAHFWFWFTSVFLYLALVLVGDLPLTPVMAVSLAVIVAFCLVAFYLFSRGYRNGLVVKVIRWVGKLPGLGGWSERFTEAHREALENVDRQIGALHRQDKRAFYSALLLEYLSRIVQSMEVLFMLLLFGVDCGGGFQGILLTALHSILIVALTTLLANLIGFLPMQLGVQEGGFVISIAALGLSAALGIFVSLICRVREIIWIVIGIALMRLPSDKKE
ncbi:MAG: flippase-like domain-containing protein [Bacteroidaceae bacterium]|nr:flippase-like domain-containing protein [Bacteroidaceae bacterium]